MNVVFNRDKLTKDMEVGTYIERLAALIPIYLQGGGDMTRVVLEDGTSFEDPRPVAQVLKMVVRHFAVDLVAVRERYGEILGKRLFVPLPLSPHLVLIPLKMRTPRVQKDGTTGYVAEHLLERVLAGELSTCCQVEVRGAGRIDCLQSGEFVITQLRNARIVRNFYLETMNLQVRI